MEPVQRNRVMPSRGGKMNSDKQNAYIVTIQRSATMAPEPYYIYARDAEHAAARAARLTRTKPDKVIDVATA